MQVMVGQQLQHTGMGHGLKVSRFNADRELYIATTTKTAFCPGSIWPFVPVLEPGFGRRDKSPWRLLSRVVEPGQKVPHAKKSLRPAGFEPKTYCLAHGFLTNSPK